MLIQGYEDGPLVAGESLTTRPGFWSSYFHRIFGDEPGDARPVPEWFGDDAADTDALSEVLCSPEHWPVFRVPAASGPGAVVICRNMPGEYGVDYLLTQPDRRDAEPVGSREDGSGLSGTGLTWDRLEHIADTPSSSAAEGVEDPSVRLLLLLPLLGDAEVPEAVEPRLSAALVSAGAPRDTASDTAEHLLTRLTDRSRHDPDWASPLSGA
ncbi:hypothetical protein ACIGBL_23375 [Streptomyces sp. NPDC085614]|uniref:hypothetical protein n=1 Tax=Streptomyces sp. NPDC085614 TaxID=3365733 RepID=UPI0037D106C2